MKKYKVNVNGTNYEIIMEVMEDDGKGASPAPVAAPAPAAAAPAPVAAPAPAAAPVGGAGLEVKCPMPGNILSVNVNVGDEVKEGHVLMILEAMKMENEIMAPKSGTVTAVVVKKGDIVESGTLICTIA